VPIKLARHLVAAHRHHAQFADFGDAEGYQNALPALRRALGPGADRGPSDPG